MVGHLLYGARQSGLSVGIFSLDPVLNPRGA
ncbi:hypothetical protein HNQ07_004742 [Deinococcus metalli]|uniref:Uncharacterized protein n=1 Tax=Deinococcus metalli TaxID=1141878 RepID=A0A7W8KJD7_9DEIO|nr:hypothetical protein [Deinococcus metalli]